MYEDRVGVVASGHRVETSMLAHDTNDDIMVVSDEASTSRSEALVTCDFGVFVCLFDGFVRSGQHKHHYKQHVAIEDRVCTHFAENLSRFKHTSTVYAEDIALIFDSIRTNLLSDEESNLYDVAMTGTDACFLCVYEPYSDVPEVRPRPMYICGNLGYSQAYVCRATKQQAQDQDKPAITRRAVSISPMLPRPALLPLAHSSNMMSTIPFFPADIINVYCLFLVQMPH
jgi:hypothetical protein